MDARKKTSRENPEKKSNVLSALFFGWLGPIFWKGAKRDLQVTDLYDPLKCDESELLGDLLEREWNKEMLKANEEVLLGKDGKKKPKKIPSLIWAIFRVFWFKYLMLGISLFIQLLPFRTLQPVLQGWIIDYFDPNNLSVSRNQVIIYASGLIISNIITVFLNHHTVLRISQIGMQIRVACCSVIYRKVLRLNQAALNNTAAGRVANLVSNDVSRFDYVPLFLHYIWIMPLQVMLIGYLMWRSVGVAALVGIGAMMLQTIPIQGYLSHLSAKLRTRIANKTDERVQLMSELISGIQVIKMYSWEKPFELIVSKVRALEMKLIGWTSYLRGFYLSVMVFSERVTLYLTLITFVLMGNTLTADVTFVLASLFNILQSTCAICLPQAIIMAGETNVSLKRLEDFLQLDEAKFLNKAESTEKNGIQHAKISKTSEPVERHIEIKMVNVAANWVHGQLPPTLCEVSMKIESESLSVLVGPVGSGKSSLLHILLAELSVGAGKMSFFTIENGTKIKMNQKDIRISYSSQDPWLFSGSVRDNILFGQPYDKLRYQEVTKVCALLKDFEQLPDGDLSFVGERGASLSGGQRARVNLARAVYRDADLYLLDDPLSAVDARVGRHLFDECIKGFLKSKTRILVTHQLQYLQQADTIIVLNRGTVERQGTYEELSASNFHLLDSITLDEPDDVKQTAESNEKNIECKTKTVILSESDQISEIPESTEGYKDVSEEEVATGAISRKVYWEYFRSGGNLCSLAFGVVIFIIGQVTSSGADYWVTYWTNEAALKIAYQSNDSDANDTSYQNKTENRQEKYLSPETQWFDEYGLMQPNLAIYIYTASIIACIFFVTLRSMLFVRISTNSSRNIHNSMFSDLLRATMRFFNTNPSGRILNRFSKDIGTMDETLPKVMLEALQIFCVMTGILTMVIVVNFYMIIPTIIMIFIFYTIRVYYMKTAQDVKRIEGITKSPVFSHISSTLDGLTTIRSRGPMVEGLLRKEFDSYQDTHSGAWYISLVAASAFGLALDLISCLFIACVCYSFIFLDDGSILGGSVGLAISQALILTGMVQYGVRQSTEVISQMTSVERVLQYTKLPKEGPFTTEKPPPPNWPSKGALVFKNVSMRYASNVAPVLKDLNMDIKPGWKVGIVGRTGAGKTSLISALFRLTGDGLDGEILLDGIDTKLIGLHELRPRISIIPQEPILFSASLRYNLDPFEQYSDDQLWNSLREVELGDAMPSLDFFVSGGGSNLSVGQRQLICLARAILRSNRILVLDEATANVDHGTDTLIQNTIRRRFSDCTVLTIAHRLNTVMDSDRVVVMEGGRIVEFGHPHLLLQNSNGHFSQMIQQTGKGMAEKLSGIAESAHLLNPEYKEELNNRTVAINNDQITCL